MIDRASELERIGERIRARREYLKLTQGEVGDALGVSGSHISNWERGAREIALSYLEPLAEVLQVPVSYFFRNVQVHEDKAAYISEAIMSLRSLEAILMEESKAEQAESGNEETAEVT